MKSHHTLALALVGWYLMMPPAVPIKDGSGDLEWSAKVPLRLWTLAEGFDTAAECRRGLRARFESARDMAQKRGREEVASLEGLIDASQCISSDDPRLK